MKRSGVLMHISSLPSPGGIGTLGKEAYAFVDFIKESGMSIWQVLPIGPAGYGDSPYRSPSAFAGNAYLIDPFMLKDDGILKQEDIEGLKDAADGMYVDYDYIRSTRPKILKAAFERAYTEIKEEVRRFTLENAWLPDYVLYSALEDHFGGRPWTEWPDDAVRFREPEAMERYADMLAEGIRFHEFVQYLFFRQWSALKEYANRAGVKIFGDLPIYVAMESADTWANPDLFQLDASRRPTFIAGVPPDYFSKDGQLWENPVYDWKRLRETGYEWWIERMRAMSERYDIIRIDHFIGLVKYYSVKAGAENARHGRWRKGPGRGLFEAFAERLPELSIVAEDLGVVMRKVKRLLRECGYPGMKVLEFAFDSNKSNTHLPHNVTANTVLYTGTHDNDTVKGWWRKAKEKERRFAPAYLKTDKEEDICGAMIEAAFGSAADTVVIPMQDFLGLGSEARMNTPGTVGGNWKWRMTGQPPEEIKTHILRLNRKYSRLRD